MIGFNSGYTPKFVRQFSDVRGAIKTAATNYCESIRNGKFPDNKESFE